MIGLLPKSLLINGQNVPIRTDFRVALIVLSAMNDPDLDEKEKIFIMVDAIIGMDKISEENLQEAAKQVSWYLDGGKEPSEESPNQKKLMDWDQDEQMIFSAINSVAGIETRAQDYIHWWTFLGYFNEIHEGLFSQVLLIRQKRAKGKKLEKYEEEFYRNNKNLIDLKEKYSEEEIAEMEKWNDILPD